MLLPYVMFLRTGSQMFAPLMLFLCVILPTMSSGQSLQLLCILPLVCCVVSNGCDDPTPALCNQSLRTVVKLCTLGVWTLGVSLVS